MNIPDTELLRALAASLAVGILIGIERGWRQRDASDGSRVSGLRTFGLLESGIHQRQTETQRERNRDRQTA